MKRVFIVHRWEGSPDSDWYPWLKQELLRRQLDVHMLEMPTPEAPQIDSWVSYLAAAIGKADTQTFLVGHSIGCQTILRYLEKIPDAVKIGGAVFVAGWIGLKPAAIEDEGAKRIIDPWLHRPIQWTMVKKHLPRLIAIASDNDPFVELDDQHLFRQHLGAEIRIEHEHGHFTGDDGITALPSVRQAVLEIVDSTT